MNYDSKKQIARRVGLLIIILILIFQACNRSGINDPDKRNENWCWFVDKETGKGKWVPVGEETTLPDGDYTLFFCNGEIRQKGKIKDRKDCDTIYYFDLDGRNVWKSIPDGDELIDFPPEGKYKRYYPTCELLEEGEFRNGKQAGTIKGYYRDGNIALKWTMAIEPSEIDTITDKRQYYHSGQLKSQVFFRNDHRYGRWTWYYENGQLRLEENFVDGLLEGPNLRFYENGQLRSEQFYQNDRYHGAAEYYYESGQLERKGNYMNGKANGTWISYFEDGVISSKMYYRNGLEEGEQRQYHPNGQLAMINHYSDGFLTGETKSYYPDGKLRRIGSYENGAKEGRWTYFDESGDILKFEQFVKGRLIK